jgi:hypothetical protein
MTPHPYADVFRALANGHEDFEYLGERNWYETSDVLSCIKRGYEIRIAPAKPKTITGTVTVPTPMRKKPGVGDVYWTLDLDGGATYNEWSNHDLDHERFEFGIWNTKEKAQATCAALKALFNEGGK